MKKSNICKSQNNKFSFSEGCSSCFQNDNKEQRKESFTSIILTVFLRAQFLSFSLKKENSTVEHIRELRIIHFLIFMNYWNKKIPIFDLYFLSKLSKQKNWSKNKFLKEFLKFFYSFEFSKSKTQYIFSTRFKMMLRKTEKLSCWERIYLKIFESKRVNSFASIQKTTLNLSNK